jgi:hypothetical protein
MTTQKILYDTSADLTIALASLASSSTLLAGLESTAISNAANLYMDVLLGGYITVGTTPTINTRIEVWVHAAINDTPDYVDVLDGTTGAETITTVDIKTQSMKLAALLFVPATTSDVKMHFAPVSLASLFGLMPTHWGVFVTHNCGAALNATAGNHKISHTGAHYQSV